MGNKKEWVSKYCFLFAALISILCVLLICFFLLVNGLPAMAEIGPLNFLLGTRWKPGNDIYGIAPMILGSLYVTGGALFIGVPIGVLSAIFLAHFCPSWLYKLLRPIISLMAGIPSVIYGFFGMIVLVPLIQNIFGNGKNILTASLLLGIMILPTIVSVCESSIRAVPSAYYEGSLALGASHEHSVFHGVVPCAKSGILSAVILGMGRAVGETMAVIMVAGNQPVIPTSLLQGVRTLTSNIVLEMGYAADLHRGALIATGIVLFVFILIITFALSLLRKEKNA